MKEKIYKIYEYIRDTNTITKEISSTKKIMLELLEDNVGTLKYCIKKLHEELKEVEDAKIGNHFHTGMTKREILVNEISQYMYWLIVMDISKKVSYEDSKVFEKIEEIVNSIDISKIEEIKKITLDEIINHDLDSMNKKEYLRRAIKQI